MKMTNHQKEKSQTDNRARIREIIRILARRGVINGMTPEKLRLVVEDLGPAFVKLGQILSMRRDILGADYCEELSRLRTDVRVLDFDTMKEVIEEEYSRPIEKVFSSFDKKPIGSASIAQVYPAVTTDGKHVVVKVQRPGIRDAMARDIDLLKRVSRLLSLKQRTGNVFDLEAILDELWFAAQQETDFVLEAQNIQEFSSLNEGVKYIAAPKVYSNLTTTRVIVMEYVEGIRIDSREELLRNGYDTNEIGRKLADNYVKQMFTDGFFHADPHPGNIYVRDGKIVFIDMGMMGRLTARDRELFKGAVFAVVQNDSAELKNILLTLGTYEGEIDHAKLLSDVDNLLSRYASLDIGSINMGQAMEDFMEVAASHGITMSRGITLVGRGLITLEGVLSHLCPSISVLSVAADYMQNDLLKGFDFKKEFLSSVKSLYYMAKKSEGIPANMAELLKLMLEGEAKINIRNADIKDIRKEYVRQTGRIGAAIVAAGVFIASSLLCFAPITASVYGIPIPSIIGYIFAVLLCIRVIKK